MRVVSGATVMFVKNEMAGLRVKISMGRRLSGGGRVHQYTSPWFIRLTPRAYGIYTIKLTGFNRVTRVTRSVTALLCEHFLFAQSRCE